MTLRHTGYRVLAIAAATLGCGPRDGAEADLIFRNAVVFTAEPGDSVPFTGSVVIVADRIVYVGPDSGATRWAGKRTRVVDGTGKTLLPGFTDSHVHPYSGVELAKCDLTEDSTPEQLLGTIRQCAADHPADTWVRGTGWQLPVFKPPHYKAATPTAALLDEAVPDRPAYLTAADGHSLWVNSRAMALAGVTSATHAPPEGVIERDATGRPIGTFRESAFELFDGVVPEFSVQDYMAGFQVALEEGLSFGITAMVDANADSLMLEAYRQMDSAGSLSLRITAAQELQLQAGPSQVERIIRLRDRYHSAHLDANMAKIFEDGVIESHTAALLTPYLGLGTYRGSPNLDQARLDSLVLALDRARVQVHVHAIGDRAIRMTLDAFQLAQTVNGPRDRRNQVAHLELIDPQDIPRFKATGTIANFQPLWAYDDSYIVDLTLPVLGAARSRWLYPIHSVLRTGAVVVGGSDWSVSSMNPLEAIQVAVTRRDPEADSGPGWIPEERTDLRSMLLAYTINGAYARFADSATGSLRPGKLADLILLDRNLFELPPQDLASAQVVMTIVGGRIAYSAARP